MNKMVADFQTFEKEDKIVFSSKYRPIYPK